MDASSLEIEKLKFENEKLREEIKHINKKLIEKDVELRGLKIAFDYIKEFRGGTGEKEQKTKKESNKSSYDALLEFKAKSNKKHIVKQKILSLVEEKEGIGINELKFMIVEHFRYCSKATFYNYFKEFELEKQLKVERKQSKNVVYLHKNEKTSVQIN